MRTAVGVVVGVGAVVAAVVALWPRHPVRPASPDGPRLAWVFEAPWPGFVVGAPCVTSEGIFLAAAHSHGFDSTGAVHAIDPTSGKSKWVFDRGGRMLPAASTPHAARGRLFVGEGMHGSSGCRLHCIDAATGRPIWDYPAGDHIEGGPATDNGRVFFPAGNDGLYALEAESGAFLWNFRADLHIDSSPCVAGGRVFAGSGKSRRFSAYQVLCLDARTGNPAWRTPVALPAWGAPAVVGNRVLIGLGNGRLTESAHAPEKPAGAIACIDAGTGTIHWTFAVGDAVFGRPAVVGGRVVFGSRDGNLYGLDADGREVFRVPTDGPVVASVTEWNGLVYAVSVPGRLVCIDPATGREVWRHEIRRPGVEPSVFAAPTISGSRLYVAAEMKSGETSIVTLFCFDLPVGTGGGS